MEIPSFRPGLPGHDRHKCHVLYAEDAKWKTSQGDLCPWNEITTPLDPPD